MSADDRLTPAQRVWQECDRSRSDVRARWSDRDVVIHAIESFARSWGIEFDFRIHDPNDVKELARWIMQHLDAKRGLDNESGGK